jgi:hypothetical protein
MVRVLAGVVPGLGKEQPPVQRARRRVGCRVHRDADLDVADLAQSARVLPCYAGRGGAVLLESGVIDHPRFRLDQTDRLAGQHPTDRFDRPRRGGHELLQLLVIDTETIPHRLHRLPTPLQHQPLQIKATLAPLILPRQGPEDLLHKLIQAVPHLVDLIWLHTKKLTDPRRN